MPINAGAKPSISVTPSGTQNVKIVAWDSTASIPTGINAIGAVSIIAGTATQNVNVVVSTAVAMSGTGNVLIGGATTVSSILITTAGPWYQQNATAIAATGTGILVMGLQSGATTSRALMITTSGDQRVFQVNAISGSASIINTVAISGTVTALGISGSASVINTVAVSGSVTALALNTTADMFAIPTGGSIRYAGTSTNVNQLWLTITTSAAVIVVTSAANKVHIVTSLWMNGNTSAAFKWQSATTDIGTLFIATSGVGMVLNHNAHGWHRTTVAQSLVASAAASGSYSGWISYITISG